jgi:MFS family permease
MSNSSILLSIIAFLGLVVGIGLSLALVILRRGYRWQAWLMAVLLVAALAVALVPLLGKDLVEAPKVRFVVPATSVEPFRGVEA